MPVISAQYINECNVCVLLYLAKMSKKLRSDVTLLFDHVVKKAAALGIDESKLSSLPSVREMRKRRTEQKRGFSAFAIPIILLAIIILWYPNLHLFHALARIWLRNSDLHLQPCTINMPTSIQDMFRPPVDCSMCRDVFQVDRLSEISVAEFKKKYAYTGHPVVITDSTSNWTALKHFNFAFFKSLYSEDSPTLESSRQDCQFFPYETEFKSLGQVFNMSEERALLKDKSKPWYIGWSNCDSSAANALRKHYERPYFLPADAESSKTDWIFMGSPGYGAHLHIDHVVNPSWQAQISGRKHWTLEPPPECGLDCRGLEVTVEPGEIIVLDTNWWFHKTRIVGEQISVTIGSEYD